VNALCRLVEMATSAPGPSRSGGPRSPLAADAAADPPLQLSWLAEGL
jgi:hypothetical protein